MPTSAFIVKVPSAESLVHALRDRFDATSRLGVPAHITVLVPFMDPALVTDLVLAQAQRALERTKAFAFSLSSVGRFPATAYLAPEPAAPFIAMTRALSESFPDFPPYGGEHQEVVPHLTAAHGSAQHADEAEDELRLRIGRAGPVIARCGCVTLIENASGRWREMHTFHLPGSSSEGR